MKNPVWRKEMRGTARSVKTSIGLFIFNALLAIWTVGCFCENIDVTGRIMYEDYAYISRIYVMLVAVEYILLAFIVPAVTAGAIAGERERQTLDILLTTPMGCWQIIWGKLVSSIGTILLYIVSSLPIFSVVFLIGGVDLPDVVFTVFYAFVFSVLIGSFGIFFSTLFKRSILATVTSYGIEIAILVFPYLCYALFYVFFANENNLSNEEVPSWIVGLGLFSPIQSLISLLCVQVASEGIYKEYCLFSINEDSIWHSLTVQEWFWLSVVIQIMVAAFMLFLATKRLNPLRKTFRVDGTQRIKKDEGNS